MQHSRFAVATASVGAIGLLVVMSAPVWAHASYEDSTPANRAVVSQAPGTVTAEFTEPAAKGSFLLVTDPCGKEVDDGRTSIDGRRLTVNIEGRAAGRYKVEYHVISTLDGHHTTRSFTFTATEGLECEDSVAGSGTEGQPGNAAFAFGSDKEDISTGGLLLAYAIAAVIGAAGGAIYGGLAPKR